MSDRERLDEYKTLLTATVAAFDFDQLEPAQDQDCDNLNTHSIGAFYDTFEPGIARSLARRLDIVPTPKHGSWLNIAENELSALTAQCVKGCRFATIEELREEVIAWANQCNTKQKGVDWQFTTDNARIKLRSLCPNF